MTPSVAMRRSNTGNDAVQQGVVSLSEKAASSLCDGDPEPRVRGALLPGYTSAVLIHRSNKSERLVDILVDVLQRASPDPMASEWIAVQSRGMERWLSLELSRRLGVWANPCFPFPRALIGQLLDVAEPSAEQAQAAQRAGQAFSEQTLVWSMAALLDRHAEHPELALLGQYLETASGTAREARLFQLAERLARRVDDYTLYRGELVQGWQAGQGEGWQPFLWRTLVARHGGEHVAARAERYFEAARRGRLRLDALPARLCLFGVGSLPPLYLRALQALPDAVEVHLFVVNPCREYWSLIRTERSIERRAAALGSGALDDQHFEVGNPLLASFGRLGREFAELLEQCGARDGAELYDAPDDATLLGALQADILALRDPHRGSSDATRRLLAADDGSLCIHSCHSPTRELQVLHDQLLELLSRDESLEPRDIVVMAPDIETYAPVIEAVFGAREGQAAIPYQVADRGVAVTHEVVDACIALLEVLPSRLGSGQVLDLLGHEPIRRRFGIDAEDLETCRGWVADSGIRWGMDAAHREREGQPAFDGNTWRFGLERLLLGRAFGSEAGLYFGRLACDGMEGKESSLLGALASFAEALFEASKQCAAPRSVADWQRDLGPLLERMLLPAPELLYQLQALREALALLAERAAQAGFVAAIDLTTLVGRLEQALGDVLSSRLGARGFLAGGVTFCQLTPMRSIPFRVVCLVGLDDEAFPRNERALSFDLMAQSRQLGDRSRRDDDRYLFLEALLSARERLLLSYVGQGVQDNEVRPPSVVVSELLDAVRRGFVLPGSGPDNSMDRPLADYEARLVVRHPLQPFSPRYFRTHAPGDPDARLFSYAAHYCEGARALTAPVAGVQREARQAAEGGFEPGTELTIEQLERYLGHPARCYVQLQLGVYLGDDAVRLEEREPIELDALERWALGTDLLGQDLSDSAMAAVVARERARGQLPLGTPGLLALQGQLPMARGLLAAGRELRAGSEPESRQVLLEVAGVRLSGALAGLSAGGRVHVQYSKLGSTNQLALWLRHLVLNCALAELPTHDPRRTSHLVARAEKGEAPVTFSLSGVEDARAELARLVELMVYARQGALPLFKGASPAYAAARVVEGESAAAALEEARTAYAEAGFIPDAEDPYVRQLYSSFEAVLSAPEPAAFEAVAMAVWGPLLTHRVPS
jgi:exodeoxyribonuclease V gamma subunit